MRNLGMRIITSLAFLVVVALAGCGGGAAGPPAHADVPIASFKFAPQTIVVKAGGSVTWTNRDRAPHTATGEKGAFDTDTLRAGQSKRLTFSKPGTYAYYCVYHRFMTGTVQVK